MIHLIYALKAEALSLINLYQLKKVKHLPFTLYANKEISLLITQMGQENAKSVSTQYFEYAKIQEDDILINIGICAAHKEHKISDILFIDTLNYQEKSVDLSVIKYKEYKTSPLISFDDPQTQMREACADMEAFGLITNALAYFKHTNISVLKIVSDHYAPQTITKERVLKMMHSKSSELKEIIEEIQCQQQ